MEYVYFMQATEEQYKKLMNLLDLSLKKDGLEAIQDVVDLYNVLVSANKVPVSQLPQVVDEKVAVKTEEKTAETVPDFPG